MSEFQNYGIFGADYQKLKHDIEKIKGTPLMTIPIALHFLSKSQGFEGRLWST